MEVVMTIRGLGRAFMVAAVAVAVTAGGASAAGAQTSATPQAAASPTPEDILRIQAAKGVTLRVTTIDGAQQTGWLDSVSTDTISILPSAGKKASVSFSQIASISRPANRAKSIGKGLLIGLGASAAITALSWRVSCEDDCLSGGAMFGMIAAGAGIGAGIGAAASHDEVLYRRRHQRTIALAPLVSKTRKGMAVTITWR
jgi:hypothetical protein